MKTTINFIAILSILFTFSVAIAQEGIESNNNNYVQQRALDLQQQENPIQEQIATSATIPVSTRIQAASELINYQAVARNAGGNLMINAAITIDFEIRDGAGGSAVFNETQNLNTDANGVFSAQIGSVNSLASVNWLDITPWLDVTMNGANVGETAMASVPTALHSKQSGIVMIHGSGTSNPDKMIAQHSPSFPDWGIGYTDASDDVDFIAGGTKTLSINLNSGDLTTLGSLEVNATTTAPQPNRVYGNSLPIAFGKFFNDGTIDSGYGITSVTNPSTGVYLVTLDNSASSSSDLIPMISPFTASGLGETVGYNPISANSFEVKIFDANGDPTSSAFSIIAFAN